MTKTEADIGGQDVGVGGLSSLGTVVWLLLASLGLIAFYWIGLVSLLEAWQRPEYSHAYFIPFIALFLLLRGASRLSFSSDRLWVGFCAVVGGLGIGLLGNLAYIPDIVTYGLLLCIAGLVFLLVGFRAGLRLWAPLLYLGFMLPLPNFLYWKFSISLQLLSSKIGTSMISALGIPVYLEGNIIDLGTYQLQVAEACSGLNYLFPLMSFGFLVAIIYKGPVWHRVVLFLSTIPITIIMNSLRIAMVGVLVDRYGPEQADEFLHAFEGWVIFVACLAMLMIEVWLLRQISAEPRPASALLDIGTDGLLQSAKRIASINSTRALISAAVLVAVAGLAWQAAPATPSAQIARAPFAVFPRELGPWSGATRQLDPAIAQVLNADDYLMSDYSAGSDRGTVNLFVAFYNSQTSGSGIHSPEVCIPTGGWEVSRWESRPSGYRLPSGKQLVVNRAVVQKDLDRQLVYYWFDQRGRLTTSSVAAKISTLMDSVTKGRTDGALVRLVTPIRQGETPADADSRLARFLDDVYPQLPRFIPGM
jgi:exosortase D (VPLPA-CTERM-specific)